MDIIRGSVEVYLFRGKNYFRNSDTFVAVALDKVVVSTFGAGGSWGEEGIIKIFGGAMVYKNDETGVGFIGVWGKRKAARFRAALARHNTVTIIQGPPPARLVCKFG